MEEEKILKSSIPKINKVSHIGSTAIHNIWSKPIIDILLEIPKENNIQDYKELIISNGYICMLESRERMSFNKGYTENGFDERVFHLHLRYVGDNDELYFRDYLNERIDVAKEYEKLKLLLWKEFEYNRDGYTKAKTEFVQKYTAQAKEKYGNRY